MAQRPSLAALLSEFEEEAALGAVRDRLAAGEDPMVLVEECRRGMQIVGKRYEQREYFIAALIMAGEVFREVLEILGPRIVGDRQKRTSGTILLCTVKGDIHDIGKDIAATLFVAHGFEVVDLGVDVSPARVADAVVDQRPDIVGLSCLLTSAFGSMKLTVDALRQRTRSWGSPVPVILGGSPVNQKVSDFVGADAWCSDAVEGVRLAQGLLQGRQHT